MTDYSKVITSAGLRENLDKRLSGNILALRARHLGTNTGPARDIELLRDRGWKSYWGAKTRLAGCPTLSNTARGQLIIACGRSILCSAAASKSITGAEVVEFVREDTIMLRDLRAVRPAWKREKWESPMLSSVIGPGSHLCLLGSTSPSFGTSAIWPGDRLAFWRSRCFSD